MSKNKNARVYEAQSSINAIDFELLSNYNVKFLKGENCNFTYSQSSASKLEISDADGVLKVKEVGERVNFIKRLFRNNKKADLILTLPEDTVLSVKCRFDGDVAMTLPADWQYGNIEYKVNGNAVVNTQAKITAESFNIFVSGGGDFQIDGNFAKVNLDSSGETNVKLNGDTRALAINSSGSATLTAEQFNCPSITVNSSGSLNMALTGAGEGITLNTSGLSKVNASAFALVKAWLDVSGCAEFALKVSDRITANVSGRAVVNYYDEPQIDRNISGSAKFTKVEEEKKEDKKEKKDGSKDEKKQTEQVEKKEDKKEVVEEAKQEK